jgi:hypothetical protein
MKYNWQQKDWPEFTFDLQEIDERLFEFASDSGLTTGMLNAMSEELKIIDADMLRLSNAYSDLKSKYYMLNQLYLTGKVISDKFLIKFQVVMIVSGFNSSFDCNKSGSDKIVSKFIL